MKPIAQELAELGALNVAELVERYVELFGRTPRCKQPTWMFKKIAWEIQARRFGGLSKRTQERLEELMAEIDLDLGAPRTAVKTLRQSTLGTSVQRLWSGRMVRATSVQGGWEHEGVIFRSLSAVAKHVTGSHWSGPGFFKVTKRRTT